MRVTKEFTVSAKAMYKRKMRNNNFDAWICFYFVLKCF